jgi:subtilase family serine protease
MLLHWRALAVLATILILASATPSLAQSKYPHSILVDTAEFSTDASAVFSCELRYFDPSKNSHGSVPCYGPSAIRAAYGLTALLNGGLTGAGRTIVILDAFGSPTASADLNAFDVLFGLPAPPSFTIVRMAGTPAFNPTDGNQVGWAEETSLDVQWSHATAPGANIVLVEAKSNSDVDLIAGLNYAIDHRLGDVVSMSFGESEVLLADAAGEQLIDQWEQAFKRAAERHISLFVSSGDQGSTNTANDAGDVFPYRNVSYPASSPHVTAVGGTNLYFGVPGPHGVADGRGNPNGTYLGEKVWNDEAQGIAGAGGGGVSALFEAPEYQEGLPRAVRKSLNDHRGIPDVAYNAGVVGGVVVHLGFAPFSGGNFIFGGTSAGAPQWAGIIADINQAVGHSVGFINSRLYRLGKTGVLAGLSHDITMGNNGFCFSTAPSGAVGCVPGFSARPGWDLATGWGTPNLATLITLLNEWDEDGPDVDFDRR